VVFEYVVGEAQYRGYQELAMTEGKFIHAGDRSRPFRRQRPSSIACPFGPMPRRRPGRRRRHDPLRVGCDGVTGTLLAFRQFNIATRLQRRPAPGCLSSGAAQRGSPRRAGDCDARRASTSLRRLPR
jgi:hypothetical protein